MPNLSDIKLHRIKRRACSKIVKWWRSFCFRRRGSEFSSNTLDPSINSFTSLASFTKKISLKMANRRSVDLESLSDDSSFDADNNLNMVTSKSKMLGKESFKTMVENEKLGDILIVEACYILVGTKQDAHSLLFRSL